MPIFDVTAPDGAVYRVNAPEGATEKEAISYAQNLFNKKAEPEPEAPPQPFQATPETGFSSFIPAVKRGALGIASLGGDILPAMAGRVGEKLGIKGAKEYADRQMAEAVQSQQNIERNYPSAVPSYTNIKGAGDLLTYIVEAVGETIPSVLPSIFTGGAAGVIGRGAVIAAKEAAEKAVIAAAAKGVAGAELESLAMKAGVDAARKTALKYEAAGALAGSAAQNIPDVYQSIAQSTGKEALGATLVAGGFNAVLDAITPLNLMRIARKSGLSPDELIGGWVKRLGKGFAQGLITEGGTEAAQEMSTAAAEKFVDQNKNFFTRDNFVRFIDAGLKGGLGGGVLTGATNVAFNRATPPPPSAKEPPEEAAPETAAEPTTVPPTTPTSMFDEAGNLIRSTQATPEEIAASKIQAETTTKPTAEQIKADEKIALAGTETIDFLAPTEEITKLKADNKRIKTKLANNEYPTPKAIAAANAKILRQQQQITTLEIQEAAKPKITAAEIKPPEFTGLTPEAQKIVDITATGGGLPVPLTNAKIKQIAKDNLVPWSPGLTSEELISALIAKQGATNADINATPSGESIEVPGKRDGLLPTKRAGESVGVGLADAEGDVNAVVSGAGAQPPALAREVTTEVTKPQEWQGEPALATDVERRFIEPGVGQTEEDLYRKAIIKREEDKVKVAKEKAKELTVTEKIKAKERLEEFNKLTLDLVNGKEEAKRIYDKKSDEDKAQIDFFIDKYKKLKKPEAAKVRKKGEKPVGIAYSPKEYKTQLKKEKAETKQPIPEIPRKLSLAEERLADFKSTKSLVTANLEALEDLRGGTTIKLIINLMHGDLKGALQEIVDGPSDQFTALDKLIARRLLKAKTLPKLEVVPQSQIDGANGRYNAYTDTAYVGEDSMTSHTVLHEALHAFTLAIIKAHKENLTFNQGVKNLDELYEHLKNNYPELVGKYGMKNLTEFVSEVMSNSAFQEQLNAIPYKRNNIFTEFARAILRMLGISPTDNFTALSYALISTESILDVGRTLEETNPPIAQSNLDVTGLKKSVESSKVHKDIDFEQHIANQVNNLNKKLETPPVHKIKQILTTKEGGNWLTKMFQNRREVLRRIYISMERQGTLKTVGEDKNNVGAQFDLAAAIADNLDRWYSRVTRDEVIELTGKYAKAAGITEHQALVNLSTYLEVLHEPERRLVKWLMTVPLSNEEVLKIKRADGTEKFISPATRRSEILDALNSYKEPDADKRHAVVKELRTELNAIVNDKANLGVGVTDINNAKYNVVGGLSSEKIESFKQELLNKPEVKPYINTFIAISEKIKKLNESNKELNKRGNFWTIPVDNWAEFYGYDNYVPFKGKPDTEIEDSKFDANKKMLVGLQEAQLAAGGRESDADNIIIQVMMDTVNAARRAGYKDVTLSIKNAINQGYLTGNAKTIIPFDKNRADNIQKERGQNKIFHYEPDGSITVIELQNKEQREAIRNSYKEDHPFVNMLNSATSLIGQMHTRYNPSFAPINFTGDLMMNIFTMGAEFGPVVSAQLLKNISVIVGTGGLYKAGKVAVLYNKSGTKELQKYINPKSKDYDPFYADLVEYIERGGKVSYMQAFDTRSQTTHTMDVIKQGGKGSTKENIVNAIDTWGNMFEFASRAASYKTAKEIYLKQNIAKGMNPADAIEDAKNRATYYSKNLANFEQVGEFGKIFGAFYMFARPAATGAVRAIEALTPLFRAIGGEKFNDTLEGRALAQQAKTGAIMVAGLLGLGVSAYTMSYMMAGDDDDDRNRTATDDMDRWQKYMRFHIPKALAFGKEDVIFQMRWGYGLGAFASAGAQIAALGAGNSSFKVAGANIIQTGLDSFLPLPISRINQFDNPSAWILDSVTPSVFRPFLEYTMNLDGLGREIYNNRQTRLGDAYTGGDSIPELYKSAARMLFNATDGGIDISPNSMYFFANNGLDGVARIASGTYNLGLVATGNKDLNLKTDTLLFDSFFGSKSNFDARAFSSVEKQMNEIEKRIKTLESDPERYANYINDNPNAAAALKFYDHAKNQDLKTVRTEQNRVRRSNEYTPKERKELLDNLTQMSNLIKRNLLMNFESLGYTP